MDIAKQSNYNGFDVQDSMKVTRYLADLDRDLKVVFQFLLAVPKVYRGVAAPSITPNSVGDIFVDTVGLKVYMSTGVASSADWKVLN